MQSLSRAKFAADRNLLQNKKIERQRRQDKISCFFEKITPIKPYK